VLFAFKCGEVVLMPSNKFTFFFFLGYSTAGNATFLENILLLPIMGIPLLGAALVGCGSISLVYVYVLVFDFLRCMGHSNVEVFPHQIFEALPFLRYLIYTPT